MDDESRRTKRKATPDRSASPNEEQPIDDYGHGKSDCGEAKTLEGDLPLSPVPNSDEETRKDGSIVFDTDQRQSTVKIPFYSTAGRYKPHSHGDAAFRPFSIYFPINRKTSSDFVSEQPTFAFWKSESIQLDEYLTEDISPTAQPEAVERGSRNGGGKGGEGPLVQSTLAEEKISTESWLRDVELGVSITREPEEADDDDEAEDDIEDKDEKKISEAEEKVETEDMVHTRLTKSLNVAFKFPATAWLTTVVQRWKRKAEATLRKKSDSIAIQDISELQSPSTELLENTDDIMLELPLPLIKTLYDESVPILQDIVQAYERTLGKTNTLTAEIRKKLDEVNTFRKAYDKL